MGTQSAFLTNQEMLLKIENEFWTLWYSLLRKFSFLKLLNIFSLFNLLF